MNEEDFEEETSKYLFQEPETRNEDRFLAEAERKPEDILRVLRSSQPVTLEYLNGDRSCNVYKHGDLLGKGKSASVYELKDQDNKGMVVVIKEFMAKESIRYVKNVCILSSSLNEIVMSSIFNSFYSDSKRFSITFPYCQGFFVCGSKGYEIIERMDTTLSKFFTSGRMNARNFKSILFQVLYSTKFLNYRGVMHNDMHAKNIMVRGTRGLNFRGVNIHDVDILVFRDGKTEYYLENTGILAKIVDFDFASQFGEIGIVAEKVYKTRDDDWNLAYRFARSYDLLTFVAYMVYYAIIRSPKADEKEIDEIQRMVESLAEQIVERVEKTIGEIGYRKHLKLDGAGYNLRRYNTQHETVNNRSAVSKLLDMVSIPPYRPYEKYCHVNLDDILENQIFKSYRKPKAGGLVVGSF